MSGLIKETEQRKRQYLNKIPRHRKAFYLFHVDAVALIILFALLL